MHYILHSAKSLSASRASERHRNNVETQPRYVFLMAEDVNIDLFLSGVVDKHHRHEINGHQRTVIPSSTLFFELIENGDDLLVEAFFNDQPLHLGGCEHVRNCTFSKFATFLNETIAYPDVAQACQITNSTTQ